MLIFLDPQQQLGIFDDVDKPWESLAEREGGARNKGGPSPVTSSLWDNGGSPADDHYTGLTPPISPAQVRATTRKKTAIPKEK